jgi:hypothetical protein
MSTPRPTPRAETDRTRLLKKIWRAMPAEERALAVKASSRDTRVDAMQSLRAAVIQQMRMRPQTVQSWSPRQLADASAKLSLPEDLIADLLIAFHLTERVALLSAFLDAVGLPHTDGATDPEAMTTEIEPARVDAAADLVLAQFEPLACQIYFATLIALEGGSWEQLRSRLDPEHFG